MKKLLLLLILIFFKANAFAQSEIQLESSLQELVPNGYVVHKKIYGDLNNDNLEDVVLIIKGTEKSKIVPDEHFGTRDLNRRGIIVALKEKQKYKMVVENKSCFYSDEEYGGVYYVPDIEISIKKGNLYVQFLHGRYGHWQYTFRYKDSDFELIGHDASSNHGPYVKQVTSINFLTKKKLVKKNTKELEDDTEPVFKESWSSFTLENRLKLSEIKDFDDLSEFTTSLKTSELVKEEPVATEKPKTTLSNLDKILNNKEAILKSIAIKDYVGKATIKVISNETGYSVYDGKYENKLSENIGKVYPIIIGHNFITFEKTNHNEELTYKVVRTELGLTEEGFMRVRYDAVIATQDEEFVIRREHEKQDLEKAFQKIDFYKYPELSHIILSNIKNDFNKDSAILNEIDNITEFYRKAQYALDEVEFYDGEMNINDNFQIAELSNPNSDNSYGFEYDGKTLKKFIQNEIAEVSEIEYLDKNGFEYQDKVFAKSNKYRPIYKMLFDIVHKSITDHDPIGLYESFLYETNEDISKAKQGDETLLIVAIKGGYKDVFDLLLEEGVEINAQDDEANTPLHYAAMSKDPYYVKALIEKGARQIENNNGKLPQDLTSSIDIKRAFGGALVYHGENIQTDEKDLFYENYSIAHENDWLGLINDEYLITIVRPINDEPYYFYNKYGKEIKLQKLNLQNSSLRLYENDNTYFEGRMYTDDYFEGQWFNKDQKPLPFFAFRNPQGLYGAEIEIMKNKYSDCQNKDSSTLGIVECTYTLIDDYEAEIDNYLVRLEEVLIEEKYTKIKKEQKNWLKNDFPKQEKAILKKYKNEIGSMYHVIRITDIAKLYENKLQYLRRVYETNLLLHLYNQ